MSGLFITFEGGEGTGKSTQIKLLGDYLKARERGFILTREPGGTPAGESLRELLVTGDTGRWSAEAEAMLNNAARDSHVRNVIKPALAAGKIVVCDRFMDSTRAYQGSAGDCSMALIDALEFAAVGKTRPHLTLIFDLDPEIGLARAKLRSAGGEDRYERKGLAFHQKLRSGFLTIAKTEPSRCVIINANQTVDQVFADVKRIVEAKLDG